MAINKNDLRIGNLVSDIHASDRFFAKVVELKNDRCYYGSFHCNYKDLKPIPITPEILVKFGFVSNPYQDRYELDGVHVEYCGIRKLCWIEGKPHIQFAHQLQNYFYFSTNKELEFKK